MQEAFEEGLSCDSFKQLFQARSFSRHAAFRGKLLFQALTGFSAFKQAASCEVAHQVTDAEGPLGALGRKSDGIVQRTQIR